VEAHSVAGDDAGVGHDDGYSLPAPASLIEIDKMDRVPGENTGHNGKRLNRARRWSLSANQQPRSAASSLGLSPGKFHVIPSFIAFAYEMNRLRNLDRPD
jgi:hypothetical protein